MNTVEQLNESCNAISAGVQRRYAAREQVRTARLSDVATFGPLGAAPRLEAMGRAAHLTAIESRNLEATTGNYDIEQVNFLARGLRAARSVCRIVSAGTSWGTGFLVAPGVLMTNHHVLPDESSAAACSIEFQFEYDADDRALKVVRFDLDPGRLFATSPSDALDFTLVAVVDAGSEPGTFGWLPLNPQENKIVEGEPAVVIQHPQQEDKKICLFDSVMVDRNPNSAEPYLYYTTDTEKGSSGSPVFNRHWQVIALHHGSVATTEIDHRSGKPRKVVANEGVRVSRLLTGIKSGVNVASTGAMPLAEIAAMLLAPSVQGNSRPQGPAASAAVGSVAPRSRGSEQELEAATRRTKIRTPDKSHYAGRRGYDVNFLGQRVPLPELSSSLAEDAAPLLSSRSSFVLKYHHYSVVVCASRRTAYFSAVNLDGRTNPSSFDRKQRVVLESTRDDLELEAAADVWYFDPRMAVEYQMSPEVFDNPDTKFDFGHITRRMDAVWGDTPDDLLLGSDDTFHMTNCAPQVSSYNQSGDWGNLEDAVAKFARGSGGQPPRKVTLFSGPVLHPADPEIDGVQIPLAYWKVISFVGDDGELRSLGFMTDQSELVDAERRKLEGTRDLVDKAFRSGWLTTVRDISRATSLDFGELTTADYFGQRGGRRAKITQRLIDELFPI